MESFQLNLYSPLTPADHQVGNSFDRSVLCHDLALTPGLQDYYQDKLQHSDGKQQQTGTDWLLSQYLTVSTAAFNPDPSCRLDLIGELLSAIQSEPQHRSAPSNDVMLDQTNNTASFEHHRTTHGFQYTSSTDTFPAYSSGHSDAASAYNTPIVKSQESRLSSNQQPTTVVQISSEREATHSSPRETFHPSIGSTKRRFPKAPRRYMTNGTNRDRYKCRLCDKAFSRIADRKRHEERTVKHGAIKRYRCDICKTAVLSRQSDVARHKERCIARMRLQNPRFHI